MKTIVTYVTDDGKEFDDLFIAKKHECELAGEHKWEFYNHNMGLQKEFNEDTHMKFCKHCNQQKIIEKKCLHSSYAEFQDRKKCKDCGHTIYGDFR